MRKKKSRGRFPGQAEMPSSSLTFRRRLLFLLVGVGLLVLCLNYVVLVKHQSEQENSAYDLRERLESSTWSPPTTSDWDEWRDEEPHEQPPPVGADTAQAQDEGPVEGGDVQHPAVPVDDPADGPADHPHEGVIDTDPGRPPEDEHPHDGVIGTIGGNDASPQRPHEGVIDVDNPGGEEDPRDNDDNDVAADETPEDAFDPDAPPRIPLMDTVRSLATFCLSNPTSCTWPSYTGDVLPPWALHDLHRQTAYASTPVKQTWPTLWNSPQGCPVESLLSVPDISYSYTRKFLLDEFSYPLSSDPFGKPVAGMLRNTADKIIREMLRGRKLELRKRVGDDMRELCEVQHWWRKSRQEKIRKGMEERFRDDPDRPVRIHGERISFFWKKMLDPQFAFENCSVPAEFVSNASEADLVILAPYCNFKDMENANISIPDTAARAVVSLEIPVSMTEFESQIRCYREVDYTVSSQRSADIPVFYDDMRVLRMISHFGMFLGVKGKPFAKKLHEISHREWDGKSALASTFISSCNQRPQSQFREQYMEVLEELIPMDSYGPCGKHRRVEIAFMVGPIETHHQINRRMSKCRKANLYKFMIAFENSVRDNWMTEKIWDGLMCGTTIPIYWGAPNVHEFFPKDLWNKYKFFINANDFPDPRDLALYVHYLDQNPEAYEEYFQWRVDMVDVQSRYGPPFAAWKNVDGENVSWICRLAELFRTGDFNRNVENLDKVKFLQ